MEKIFIEEVVSELKTIGDMLRWAISRFNDAEIFYGHGTDNPVDEALALIMEILHLPSNTGMELRESNLLRSEKQKIADLVLKRIKDRIPVPYLTNSAKFAGFKFYVDERVLIPRSPIAELINNKFSPWLYNKQITRILDLCTGSGCIAIACAHAFSDATVDAIDLSDDALDVAQINIESHHLLEQVFPIKSDLFKSISTQEKYNLIVSNPPYVDEYDLETMPEEFKHEPRMGLEAGQDGLDLVKIILANAADYLTEDGILVVEVGNSMHALAEQYPDIPFVWVTFENGGDGVFLLTFEQLNKCKTLFTEYKDI